MLTNPEAATAAIARYQAQIAHAIPADDASLRAAIISAVTLGVIVSRHLIKSDELASADPAQEEVCRLWNLLASNTREGEVFTRLLDKIEEQRKAYGGKVFDVLGDAFSEIPLRNLLMDAIQYGERPDVKARMHEVIDASIGDGLREIVEERALASEHLA